MKNFAFVLLLFFLPFFALPEAHAQNSFYFNASLGLGADFQTLDAPEEENQPDPKNFDYTGFPSVSAGLKLGIMFRGFWTLHAMIDFSRSSGKFDGKSLKREFSGVSGHTMNFEIGPGLSIFPFRYFLTALSGTYISATYLIGIQNTSCDGTETFYNAGDDVYGIHEMDADYMNIGLAVEIGKEFKIDERLYVGAEFKYRLLGPISGSDTAGEDEDEISSRTHVSNVIAFAVTFTRR